MAKTGVTTHTALPSSSSSSASASASSAAAAAASSASAVAATAASAAAGAEARIDSEKSRVQMAGTPPSLYQLVTDKTRNLGMRTALLIQNLTRPGYTRDDEAPRGSKRFFCFVRMYV